MPADPVRLLAISAEPIEVSQVYDVVRAATAGALTVFVGTVRDRDEGRSVTDLSYSAHPTARARLAEVVRECVAGAPVEGVAAVHRVGDLTIGDVAIVVAVATPHRAEGFDVCERIVDQVKASVPIWKHQVFADGADEWVGAPS